MDIQEVQKRISALSTKTKWAAGIAVLMAAPVLYFVGWALFGVAYAATAALVVTIIGLIAVNVIPVLAFKFANWKLRALKAEAERNPIETLQNQQQEIERELEVTKKAITAFDAEVDAFRQSLANEVHAGHPEAAEAGLPVLQNMEQILQFRRLKFMETTRKVRARARKVKDAEAKYRVALAAQKVTAASGDNSQSRMRQILEAVAFDSVDRAVSTSMAELRTALMVESLPDGETSDIVIEAPPAAIEDQRQRSQQLMKMLTAPRADALATADSAFIDN